MSQAAMEVLDEQPMEAECPSCRQQTLRLLKAVLVHRDTEVMEFRHVAWCSFCKRGVALKST